MGYQATPPTQPQAHPPPPPAGLCGRTQVLQAQLQRNPLSRPTSGLSLLPTVPRKSRAEGLPGGAGVGRPGGHGVGLGEAGRASLIPQAWPPQGVLGPAGTALHLLPALRARPGGQHFPSSPESPPLAGRACGLARAMAVPPCGLGSPWLLDTFAPCPWVLWSFQGLPLA